MTNPKGTMVAETDIAVVGMAGRFPGARDLAEYWNNLRDGVESLTQLTDQQLEGAGVDAAMLRDPEYVKAGFLLPEMEMFDGTFFGFSPRDASIMDPQQRHFIECSWTAMEHAGHVPQTFDGSIGVYAGCGASMYMMNNLLTNPQLVQQVGFFLLRHTGNDKDFLATRVSYLMNLTGPSVNVQTACSTSLVAIHQAVQSLLNGECDMAIAGGSTVRQPHYAGYVYKEGEIVSPDGHCRSFDESSEGTVFGSGVGVVVLRRAVDAIADGDTIHAIIKGSAINNDGSMKVGYLAPSVDGQAKAVAEALAISGVDPETITYVEAHGTGTPVGDPIEIVALTQAFRTKTRKSGYCAIGSVKSNIGHLDTAAGAAGLIKTVLALKNKQIPPSLFFERPNPACDFESSPFFVNTTLREWTSTGAPRRAGVSALGAGGTNAHIILEEAPVVDPSDEPSRAQQLLVLSAKTPSALDAATTNLVRFLSDNPDTPLADVAFTLQVGRQSFAQRRAVAAASAREAIELLESNDPKRVGTQQAGDSAPAVAFMFAGGGAQHATMGAQLYESEPVYRAEIDRCFAFMKTRHGVDLAPLVFPRAEDAARATLELERPSLALPALFSTQFALAKLLMSWGITPQAMIGHSMGEYTAACIAGVFSMEDALSLVTVRGRLFEQLAEGGMLSVPLAAEELRPMLPPELSIAAINAPELCVASGPVKAIETLERTLAAQEIDCRRIHINVAAHSAMLEPILQEFGAFVRGIALSAPKVPFVSNVTGTWISDADATDATYWVRHLRQTVRFADGVGELLADARRVLLEVGPGRTLTTLARQHSAKQASHGIYPSMRHPDEQVSDVSFALGALGRLWTHGVEVDWRALHGEDRRVRIPLPTYPFERQRHWIAPGKGVSMMVEEDGPPRKRPDVAQWLYQPSWRRTTPSAIASPDAGAVLLFADDCGLSAKVADGLRAAGRDVWTVTAGSGYARIGEREYTIAPADREAYELLLRDLAADGVAPADIVHCFSVTPAGGLLSAERVRDLSFYSLLHLAQAVIAEDLSQPIRLSVVSSDMQQVAGEAVLSPEKALLLGPCKVIGQEVPNVLSRSIDVVLPPSGSWQERQLAQQLVREIGSPVADEMIALRGADRWVQTFEHISVDPDARPSRVREGGVYLITGGLGGIGLTVAEYLARVAKARLVLVGRTAFPGREEWDGWIARRGESDRVSRAIAQVRALEALGAEVMVARGDVTNRERMAEIVRTAVGRFGTINGVVHGAGALDDGLIATKDRATAERVLAPKVEGTLSLDAALAGVALDFFVVFSSRGAIAGPAGQVDYVAANAFLDAFAHRKTTLEGVPTIAVNWSAWRDVGMAASLSSTAEIDEPAEHPLLDRRVRRSAKEDVFSTVFSIADHWLLDGHRIRGGEALIPGTGYLELAQAAFREGGNARDLELRDVFFISPFVVHADERRELRVKVRRNGGESEIVIIGEGLAADGTREWHEHARAIAAHANGEAPAVVDVDALLARCTAREQQFTGEEEREHLVLGRRWSNIRRINYGVDEAVATLELPAEFADDLTRFALHPAMLDVATACAQQLIHGFDPHADFYVPASYTRLRARGSIPRRCFSHIQYLPSDDKDIAAFNVTILDESGRTVVEIEEFLMMRVSDKGRMASDSTEDRKPVIHVDAPADDAAPAMSLEDAITPAEGVEVFRRALADAMPSQIVVSPQDLGRYLTHLRAPKAAGGAEPQESAANLAEIEAVLATHEAVRQGIVLSHGERAGTRQLAAYVVYEDSTHATASELRRFLRERLPEEMVPQHFVELDALPLSNDGKIDRAALPNPFGPGDDYVAPRTPMERTVATIWQELLGVARVSVHDNFLDAGGHSLLAMRVITRIAKQTGVRINQSALNLLTLEQIAAECEQKATATQVASAVPAGTPDTEPARAPQGFRQRFLGAFKSASRG